MVTDLTAVQTNANRRLFEGQQSVSDQITTLYSGIGSVAWRTSGSVSSSHGLLDTSQHLTTTQLENLTDKTRSAGENSAATLLGSMYDLSSAADSSGRTLIARARTIVEKKKNISPRF